MRPKPEYYFSIIIFVAFISLVLIIENLPSEDSIKKNKKVNEDFQNQMKSFLLVRQGKIRNTKNIIQVTEKIILNQKALDFENRVLSKNLQSNYLKNQLGINITKIFQENNNDWQQVDGTKNKFYVYSAYFDNRKRKLIRIIAATKTKAQDKVKCIFWYKKSFLPFVVDGTNVLIRENWNLNYSAFFILCPLKEQYSVPDAVSVIERKRLINDSSYQPSNWLNVENNFKLKQDKNNTNEIAVCVKPIHYSYDKILNLIEFIELNLLLGVNHFVMYNHTIGKNTECLLKKYIKDGLVTVLPWNLNLTSQKEIRTEGLFAALNDCLYRTMYKYKHVAMIDLDEYIIPYKFDHLNQMIGFLNDHITNKNQSISPGAYSFQNSFFYLQWPDDEVTAQNEKLKNLITISKTRRKIILQKHKIRSKCIVNPEKVIEMGNHFVWEFVPGSTMINVSPTIGFLHHYRICEFGGDDCVKAKSVIDKRVHFWGDKLIKRVDHTLNVFISQC